MSGLVHAAIGGLLGGLDGDMLMTLAGSLLPDADTRRSIMGRVLPFWLVFKHRGFMHSVYALILAFLLDIHFGIGYLSHILLDRWSTAMKRWA